ncbi:Teichoic acids export ATP-binding protein TagH [freshwater sediment metagenome]|uniref:Teichoic acids export ATP-binding protein TagH n=1 Tax=freshwater sediment metagenome TaxID=556182 RepID=A0AA48M2R6_9ZZZZ
MTDVAILIENLSKAYLLGHHVGEKEPYTALRDVLARNVRNLLRKTRDMAIRRPVVQGDEFEEFWALKDVSFEVKRGEVLGVIGRNGAGKSTLLKVLSRITEPTKGRVTINGRVASLLEVGTGFHPELTGRENIFLNGAILGMSRQEIKRRFDEIVDFAEVEKFLDTPVKRYSSGMYVRLAFAVAAHLETEILVVDEVLAVGDVQFQKKCLGKMQDVTSKGRTVLFISHNMAAIEQLTHRAILLKKGELVCNDDTPNVVARYLGHSETAEEVEFDVEHAPRRWPGNQAARILRLRFERQPPVFYPDEDFSFVIRVRANANLDELRTSMTIFADDGSPVGACFGSNYSKMELGETREFKVTLPNPRLAPGNYNCGVAICSGDNVSGYVAFDVVLDTLSFEMRPAPGDAGTFGRWERGWGPICFAPLSQSEVPAKANLTPTAAIS